MPGDYGPITSPPREKRQITHIKTITKGSRKRTQDALPTGCTSEKMASERNITSCTSASKLHHLFQSITRKYRTHEQKRSEQRNLVHFRSNCTYKDFPSTHTWHQFMYFVLLKHQCTCKAIQIIQSTGMGTCSPTLPPTNITFPWTLMS